MTGDGRWGGRGLRGQGRHAGCLERADRHACTTAHVREENHVTTSPTDPPNGAGTGGQGLKLLAVTACPTGIAHTYMAPRN